MEPSNRPRKLPDPSIAPGSVEPEVQSDIDAITEDFLQYQLGAQHQRLSATDREIADSLVGSLMDDVRRSGSGPCLAHAPRVERITQGISANGGVVVVVEIRTSAGYNLVLDRTPGFGFPEAFSERDLRPRIEPISSPGRFVIYGGDPTQGYKTQIGELFTQEAFQQALNHIVDRAHELEEFPLDLLAAKRPLSPSSLCGQFASGIRAHLDARNIESGGAQELTLWEIVRIASDDREHFKVTAQVVDLPRFQGLNSPFQLEEHRFRLWRHPFFATPCGVHESAQLLTAG